MAKRREPVAVVDLKGAGGRHSFFTPSDLHDWLAHEQKFWSWLPASQYTKRQSAGQQRLFEFAKPWQNNALEKIVGLKDRSEDEMIASLKAIAKDVQEAYTSGYSIHSQSRDGQFLDSLDSTHWQERYYALVAILDINDQAPNANFYAQRGFIKGVLHKSGLGDVSNEKPRYNALFEELSTLVNSSTENNHKLQVDSEDLLMQAAERLDTAHQDQVGATKHFGVFLDEADEEFKAKQIDRGDEFANQIDEQNSSFDDQMEVWQAKIKDLEDLYEHKLQLEKPVAYWEEIRDKHLRYARIRLATVFIVISGFMFGVYEVMADPKVLSGISPVLDLSTVRGSLLVFSFVSAGFFLVAQLTKMTLSSYHLAEDARERRQLTYVFLAMSNDEKFTEEERKLALQAIFSRSESGLLKGDHSPTMPTAVFRK